MKRNCEANILCWLGSAAFNGVDDKRLSEAKPQGHCEIVEG